METCPVQSTEYDKSDQSCKVQLIWKWPNCENMESAVKHSNEMDQTVDKANVTVYCYGMSNNSWRPKGVH